MSFSQLYYHIIFRTKSNVPAIFERHEKELYAYILGYMRNKGYHLLRIGGMSDHIHMFVSLPPQVAVSEFVRDLKASTSKMLKENPKFPVFDGWSVGYAAFSYSQNEKDMVINYIKNQKEHHKIKTLAEELRDLGIAEDMLQ